MILNLPRLLSRKIMLRSKAFSLAFYPCSSNNILFRDDLDHSSTPLRLLDDEFDDCKSNTASFIPNNKSTASTSLSSSSTLKQRKRQTATLPTSNTNNSIEKASSPSRTSTTSSASPSTSSPRVVRRIGTKSDEFELPPGWKK